MATSTPASISFEEILDLTLSLETFFASVNQNLSCWQSVIRHIANDASIYLQIFQEYTNLRSRVELLESANKQLIQALNQMQQNIAEKCIYEQNKTWQSSFVKYMSAVF